MSSGGQDAKLFARVSTSYLLTHFHFSVLPWLEDIRAVSFIIARQKCAAASYYHPTCLKKPKYPVCEHCFPWVFLRKRLSVSSEISCRRVLWPPLAGEGKPIHCELLGTLKGRSSPLTSEVFLFIFRCCYVHKRLPLSTLGVEASVRWWNGKPTGHPSLNHPWRLTSWSLTGQSSRAESRAGKWGKERQELLGEKNSNEEDRCEHDHE